ncbi:MAG: hypothetical protein J5841_10060, partial [Clostridia bacterium]|nr:hypothetical protein [Clostridia bacterium]
SGILLAGRAGTQNAEGYKRIGKKFQKEMDLNKNATKSHINKTSRAAQMPARPEWLNYRFYCPSIHFM